MQDLEDLKKDVGNQSFGKLLDTAHELIARCESAEKECAEIKDKLTLVTHAKEAAWCKVTGKLLNIKDFVELAFKVNSEKEALVSELKELREQKPAIYFDGRKVLFNPEYKGLPSPNGEYYAAPVAQSRDSAEPDVRDIGNELHNISTRIHYAGDENLADELGAIAVRLWGIRKSTTISENASPKKLSDKDINEIIITYMDDYSSTTLEMCRSVEKAVLQSNANDHIEHVLDMVQPITAQDEGKV